MNAVREAFDLHNPACRLNFRCRLAHNWHRLSWWRLVWADTKTRICSTVSESDAQT